MNPSRISTDDVPESLQSLTADDSERSHSRLVPPGPLQETTNPTDVMTDVDLSPEPAASSISNDTPKPQPDEDFHPSYTRTRSMVGEITSVIAGLVCMVLALTILLCIYDTSMASWKLPVQPNTAVALLATLTRGTLMYPLAECLGQLKWTFFERPRTLDLMHTFHVASRGPLGVQTSVARKHQIASIILRSYDNRLAAVF